METKSKTTSAAEGDAEIIDDFDQVERSIRFYLDSFRGEMQIENFTSEPQARWNAALMYVQKNLYPKKSNILKSKIYHSIDNNSIKSTFNAYNYELLNTICEVYIYLCSMYDKEISVSGYSYLTGVDTANIYDWHRERRGRLSPLSACICQKLRAAQEQSLEAKLATGARNPVGIIAILNHRYGWSMPGVSHEISQRQALQSSDSLPKLSQNHTQFITSDSSDIPSDDAQF